MEELHSPGACTCVTVSREIWIAKMATIVGHFTVICDKKHKCSCNHNKGTTASITLKTSFIVYESEPCRAATGSCQLTSITWNKVAEMAAAFTLQKTGGICTKSKASFLLEERAPTTYVVMHCHQLLLIHLVSLCLLIICQV